MKSTICNTSKAISALQLMQSLLAKKTRGDDEIFNGHNAQKKNANARYYSNEFADAERLRHGISITQLVMC
jgi:hypothetical protein